MFCFPVDNCIFGACNVRYIQKFMGVMMLGKDIFLPHMSRQVYEREIKWQYL